MSYNLLEFVYKQGIEAFNLLNFLSSQLLSLFFPNLPSFHYSITPINCERRELSSISS
jgi:hypothetical protein